MGYAIVVPLDGNHMRPLIFRISVTRILCHLALSAAAFNAMVLPRLPRDSLINGRLLAESAHLLSNR